MCGINGFTFPDRDKLRAMNSRLKHRGPDDQGEYVDEHVSLGNTRLAIIDLSPKGHQPMTDRTGRFVITFNGEIYNFKELREALIAKRYTFRSATDTEVILNLYKEYGEKAFPMLNGMFALAIWDKKEKKLVLARDRVGIKPLYYAIQNSHIFFSSEIKALFVHRLTKEIDHPAMDLYMRLMYIPSPMTIFKGIHKLIPGQLLIWKEGNYNTKFFWKLPERDEPFTDKKETKARLHQLLFDAVRRQLVSDRPVGIFLSGGIDSSTILALATKMNASPVKSFSIGFSGIDEVEKYNADFLLAKKTAAFFKADHHEFLISPKQALTNFGKLVASMDEPISNPTHIPTYVLAREARKKVVVALGGDGGDELFGGYDRYLWAWYLDQYQRLPRSARQRLIAPLLRKFNRHASEDFFENLESEGTAQRYLVFMGQSESELEKIYTSDRERVRTKLSTLRGFRHSGKSFHERIPILDFLHWLPEESLMRSDMMAMQQSLEQRVPFLDNELVDAAFRIPFPWKVGWRTRKKILRETFTDLLPAFIIDQPKRGFFSPAAKWLRNKHWKPFVDDVLSPERMKKTGVFNSDGIRSMVQEHLAGERYHANLIWCALTFQLWYANNF
jgi:asparagine synthase (glutamine-hydrolysing)